MTDLSRHYSFLLDLLAQQGPLTRGDLERLFERMGTDASEHMWRALRRLVESGNVLEGQSPPVYFVAPAVLVELRKNAGEYALIGHPGAANILKFYGEVAPPSQDGARLFRSKHSVDSLERLLADFGISVRRAKHESDRGR